jgi:putative ABC transport system permease protein
MVLGIAPDREPLARDYVFEEGDAFPRANEVLLESGFAKNLGIELGDPVRLLTKRGPHRFWVVGLLAPQGAARFQGGAVVFMRLKTAQYWFQAPNEVNTVDLVLDEAAAEDRVVRDLAARLPPGLSVLLPSTRTELARETLLVSEQGLGMAAALSLVAAAFIIMNSLLMSIGERRRRLAALRTIGATRRQIFSLVIREGMLLGVVGTLLGILAGIGGAALLMRAMEGMFQTALPAGELDGWSVLKAAVLGPGMALAAVLAPAWSAARISPLEGLRPVPVEPSRRGGRWIAAAGGCLMALAALGTVLLYQGVVPPAATPPVVAASLVGMSLLIPWWLAAVVRPAAPVLEWANCVNAFLACRQLLRQHMRSSLAAGVLFVAVVMCVGMGNSVLNNTQRVNDWIRRAIVGDFVVRGAKMFNLTTGESAALPDGVIERVGAVPGVLSVEPWTFASARAEGQVVMVLARSFPVGAPLSLDLCQGDPDDVRWRLSQGEAVISTVVAHRLGKGVGDTIALATKHGPRPLRIAATCDDYIMGGSVIYVQDEIADKWLGLRGVHALLIRIEAERRAEAETALRELCEENGLLMHSIAELAQAITSLMSGVSAALWAMLVLGFIVASFGLVNTLTINVLEQTRELGLMRMVGMTRLQVGKYVLCQAAVIGIVGLLPGAAAGELTAYIINRVSIPMLGHPIAFDARPEVVVGCLACGLALSLVAACLPAWRAAHLLVGEAIQYE